MERLPELRDSTSDRETYYGVPLLKEHVWKAAVPAYFYVGGVAGASAALGALGNGAAIGAGILGLPLAGYTAVLLSNTAVPVWQGARTSLPPLFVSSAMTSAACVLDLCELDARERRVVRRFGLAGKVADL